MVGDNHALVSGKNGGGGGGGGTVASPVVFTIASL